MPADRAEKTVPTEGAWVRLADLVGEAAVPRLRDVARAAPDDDPRYFGLKPYSEIYVEGCFGYFVGIGRLPQAPDRVLHVRPRVFGGNGQAFRIDYLALYAACAADPEVSRHLDHCLTVYVDEEPIAVEKAGEYSPLIALAYLKSLHELVQRHLRRGFVTREEDLRGRVRGQIALGRYAARSLARAHPEIVPCRFQALEQNTLENRILRTALAGARRLLEDASGRGLGGTQAAWHVWARQADAALAGAAIARIMPRDFQAARKSGAYRHYARPLALARAVLTRTGFDPNQPIAPARARLVPFRLATAELFERYVEVCLRRLPDWKVWAGYHDSNLGSDFPVRPDFLVGHNNGQRVIVDAKYKDFGRQASSGANEDNSLRRDVYQTVAYSRHRAVQAQFGAPSAVVLCYPAQQAQADNALQAALAGENPRIHRHIGDFDLRVTLMELPVPTVRYNRCTSLAWP